MRALADALAAATVAVAFRVPGLTGTQRQQIADFAAQQIGQGFDYIGIVEQYKFRANRDFCLSKFPPSTQAQSYNSCINFFGDVDLGTNSRGNFYCAELVVAAYQAAGVPITNTPPNWTAPGDLAEIALTSGILTYVGLE